ncbi:MAG: choice-of-anchor Q domain-containing protein [Chitinivibrionales bacterium]|nr:choice-of-anchor Q domain-containing protein [Chitinivibrionales bacterium]
MKTIPEKCGFFGGLFVTAALILSIPSIPNAAMYYVATTGNDANNGSFASPWRTIQKAASAVTAGATVLVRSGVYSEIVQPANSGAAGAPITYRPDSGATVTIDGSAFYGNSSLQNQVKGLVNISGKSYINILGFNFVHGYGNGIEVDGGANNIRIGNNTFNSDFGWYPIKLADASNVHDVEIYGNYIHRTYITTPGFYAWGDPWGEMISVATAWNVSVHDNIIDLNQKGEGINFKNGTHDSKAYRNKVSNTTSVGMYIGGWDLGNYNIEYYGNIVSATGGNGPALDVTNEINTGITSHDILIDNNIITTDGNTIGLAIGHYGYGTLTNISAINNTIYNAQVAVNPSWIGTGITFSNVVLRNNIFCDDDLQVRLADGVVSADHNGFYNSTAIGTNAVTGNPLFVNAAGGDFHLRAGSPLIDAGSSAGAPAMDFDGLARPQGAGFDIGAYEYTTPTAAGPASPAAYGIKSFRCNTAANIINYYLPKPCFVSIKYYDLQGRTVCSYVNNYQRAGNYSLKSPVASPARNVYIREFKAGDFVGKEPVAFIK